MLFGRNKCDFSYGHFQYFVIHGYKRLHIAKSLRILKASISANLSNILVLHFVRPHISQKTSTFTVWGSEIDPFYIHKRGQFRFPILYTTKTCNTAIKRLSDQLTDKLKSKLEQFSYQD